MDPYDYGRPPPQSHYIPATGMRPMVPRPTAPQVVSTTASSYDRSFMVAASYDHLVRVLYDMDHEGKAGEQFQSILNSLMAECSRANIEAGKSWIFDHCRQPMHMEAIADYCVTLSYSKDSFFERLHLVYLINDVLYHSERRQVAWMKDAMIPRLANLLGQAYHASGATDDRRAKVNKVLAIWEDKRFLDASVVNHIRQAVQSSPPPPPPPPPSSQPMQGIPTMRPPSFVGGAPHPHPAAVAAGMGYQGYPPPPFPSYGTPPPFYAARPMQPRPPMPVQGSSPSTAQPYPAHMAIRPPPSSNTVHIKPSPRSTNNKGETMPSIPNKPYHELPAGLMVDALKLDAAPYSPLEPSEILPISNPLTTSKDISQAVEQFYEGLDLKDSTGNFEESVESKLDRSGWEPGYLDAFYEKRENLQHDQRNKKRRNSSEGRGRRHSRSRDYRSPSPSRGRSHHRRRKRSYSRSPSYSSRSRSRSRSRSWSPPPHHRRRSRSPSPYRDRSGSRFGTYGSPQPKRPPPPLSSSSKNDDRHTAAFSQTPSDPYDAYRRSNSYNYNRDHRSSGVCFNCSKPGHLARDCPEKGRYH
ncbi:hypothetical protein K492DRAFT_176992 [Lichtheimia hyalospora FSU 10163]|nr:hypothetical protein K492DRAFT_176992 [Lichtheimia hyalospora FSU 10163]